MRIESYILKQEAREELRRIRPSGAVMTLIYLILTAGLSMVVGLFVPDPLVQMQDYLNAGLDAGRAILLAFGGVGMVGLFLNILIGIFTVVMGFGYSRWTLGVARGEEGELGDLVSGFSMVGRVLLLQLLTILIYVGWYLAAFLPAIAVIAVTISVPILGGVMIVAALVGALVFYVSRVLRYSMATYCLIDDPQAGVFEAIHRSCAMMTGNRRNLIRMELSFFGWYVLLAVVMLAAETVAVIVLAGPQALLEMYMQGSAQATAALSSPTVSCLLTVVDWPVLMWLNPYVAVTEARFYEHIRGHRPREVEDTYEY